MVVPRILVLCTLPFLALGAKKREVPSHFGLFGYGEGFGGFPLFYADGYAYIGEAAQSNISNAATVDFSLGTGGSWIGNPNTTLLPDASTANWTDTVFYLPDNTTSDKRVGFLLNNNATDGAIKTGFSFYGSTAVLIGETGTLESSFYALQVSERVHQLYWNETSLGQKPVVLRAVAPSMPPL